MAISFIQMTYNLVDILWIGRLSSRSVAAVGSIGMLMWMMNSVALISKVGAEISIGQSIGARRLDHASLYASHTTTLALFLGVAFGIFFLLFPHPYVAFYRLEHSIAMELSVIYDWLWDTCNVSDPTFPALIGSGRSDILLLQCDRLMFNILWTPVDFRWAPCRQWVEGAALATVFSQGVVLLPFIT